MQSFQVIEELNGPKGVCIYGGVSKEAQIQSLKLGAEIVVATPGRLLDLLEGGALSLQCKYFTEHYAYKYNVHFVI